MTAGLAASGVLALGTTPLIVDPEDPEAPPPVIVEIADVLDELAGSLVFVVEVLVSEESS